MVASRTQKRSDLNITSLLSLSRDEFMPITVKTDLVKIISDICAELLPDDVTIDVYFSHVQTETGEDTDTALLQTGERNYAVIINESCRYTDLPDIVASQVACVISHLQGGQARSGGSVWKKYMKLFKTSWDLRIQETLKEHKQMFIVH